eukprot:364774-Chlamydomonas_euryale.AAC.13
MARARLHSRVMTTVLSHRALVPFQLDGRPQSQGQSCRERTHERYAYVGRLQPNRKELDVIQHSMQPVPFTGPLTRATSAFLFLPSTSCRPRQASLDIAGQGFCRFLPVGYERDDTGPGQDGGGMGWLRTARNG